MQLFVGLGNPGAKYAGHRHNIGFMAVDAIASEHGFPAWRSKFQAEITDGRVGGERVLLMKPQTYMNNSGQAVGEAMRFLKLSPAEVTVFHDELDLAPGKLRVKTGGGHAGHNGLRSLHQHIGGDYRRVRLGIGHPGAKELVTGYVLHDFARADRDWLDPLLDGIARATVKLAAGDGAGFQNDVALAMRDVAGRNRRPAGTPTEAPAAAPPPERQSEAERDAGLSPLQRLRQHFSGRR